MEKPRETKKSKTNKVTSDLSCGGEKTWQTDVACLCMHDQTCNETKRNEMKPKS